MRSSEETFNLITELIEDKGGKFVLQFDEDSKEFVAQINFDGSLYTRRATICGVAIDLLLDKVLKTIDGRGK